MLKKAAPSGHNEPQDPDNAVRWEADRKTEKETFTCIQGTISLQASRVGGRKKPYKIVGKF